MKPAVSTFATVILLLALQPAQAATINFGEFAAGNTNNAISNVYAPSGVTFGSTNSGVWNGLSLGDAGNWGIEGSNGSEFLGNNGFNGGSYVTSIFFTTPVSNISFDASRSNGSSAGQQLVASAYYGSTLLASQSVMLGAINSWSTILLGIGSVSSLIITGTTTGFSPFGIDNLQFNGENTLISGIEGDVTAIPEPETHALMLAGLGLLAGMTRQRGSRPAMA